MLVPAGVGAGLTGSIAGLASLISYPALLAVGLPPVSANVTNTVALVFNSVGSVTASGPELRTQQTPVARVAITGLIGGLVGGILLLATPPGSFELIVPWLIALGALAILLPRRKSMHPTAPRVNLTLVLPAVFAISIYGGYFGAAAGVLMLALFLNATPEPLPCANALKNVVIGGANLVAAVLFTVLGSVDWAAVVPLAAGLFIGGRIGPVLVRRSPPTTLRLLIALAGLGLAIYLGIKAYR